MSAMIPTLAEMPEEFHPRLTREALLGPLDKYLEYLVNQMIARTHEGQFVRDAVRAWFGVKAQQADQTNPVGFQGGGDADCEMDGQVSGPRELTVRKALFRWMELIESGRADSTEAFQRIRQLIAAIDVTLVAELCDTCRTPLLIEKEGSATKALQVYVDKIREDARATGKMPNSKYPEIVEADMLAVFSEGQPRRRTAPRKLTADEKAEAIVTRMFTRW